jgi:orotate phosphoribosyltransferase
MNFRSINDLNTTIVTNLHKIPSDVDLIVGIPRSGLLAANLLALHLHIPLTDISGFREGRIMQGGARIKRHQKKFEECKHILVVDDSLNSGKSLLTCREELSLHFHGRKITFTVVYMNPDAVDLVDIYLELCPNPRVFEWNLMNHPFMKTICVSVDNVLCIGPTQKELEDESNYIHFLKNARPLLRTKKRIGIIVTNRFEKYRSYTEGWLHRNNIAYDRLYMQNNPKPHSKNKLNHKAKVYRERIHSKLFIESSWEQSHEIAYISGKPVYCVNRRIMVYPNKIRAAMQKSSNLFHRTVGKLGIIRDRKF